MRTVCFSLNGGLVIRFNGLLSRKKKSSIQKRSEKNIRRIEKVFGIQYGESQEKAISEAVRSPLFILTGGPGTGKRQLSMESSICLQN